MDKRIFKRYELKFLISKEQRSIIEQKLEKYMEPDAYNRKTGSYMIYNLYFDTPTDEIIRKSLDQPYYKEKLRMRCYKIPTSEKDIVFLELKKKIGGIVNKRRATLTYQDAMRFLSDGVIDQKLTYTDQQVLKEISEFLSRYPAKPKLYLSYERSAYFGKDNPEFRVTFDQNILTRRDRVNFTDGDFGIDLLEDEKQLMEIKVDGAVPLWLSNLLSELKIYKTGFSKYGTEYVQFIANKKHKEIFYHVGMPFAEILDSKRTAV